MLKPEVIREASRLEQISGEWQTLGDRLPGVTPFQLPKWQLTWWAHFGSGELRAFAFWRDNRLVGIVPLFLHEWKDKHQLTLIGSGITDYLDPCIACAEVYDCLAWQLQNDQAWDVCDWQDLSTNTPLKQLIHLQTDVKEDVPCSAIPLDASFETYWQLRSADLRRNIKRYARKAEAEGPLIFSVIDHPKSELVNDLIQLHSERWRRQGEIGMVELNRSGDFLREMTASDGCSLFSLNWKGKMVAASAGFLKGKTVYSYLSAFEPAFEILGFGRYLLYRSLQWAFEGGYTSWDFLRGDEPYKASWGAVQTPRCRVLISRS